MSCHHLVLRALKQYPRAHPKAHPKEELRLKEALPTDPEEVEAAESLRLAALTTT